MVSIGHRLPQDFLDEHRRRRFAGAVAELAHERGVHELTATSIAARAGSSRATFYELFASRDACMRFACWEGERVIFGPVRELLETPRRSGSTQVSEAIAALLAAAADAPLMAELCLTHAFAVAEVDGACFASGAAAVAEVLTGSRTAGLKPKVGVEPPPRIESLLANGIVFVVGQRVSQGRSDTLRGLHAELVSLALGPFRPDRT